jgi:hypothetical protein
VSVPELGQGAVDQHVGDGHSAHRHVTLLRQNAIRMMGCREVATEPR